jgi:release factor glutamine methyltransferase
MVYTSALSLFKQIRDEITPIYGQEADMLAMLIVEDVSGFSSTDILTDHKFQTGPNFRATILKYILQLKRQEPIQYILGKAYFYDNYFEVNRSTLIPRPETEELVRLIEDYLHQKPLVRVLDIGTGSGCIANSIALKAPNASVSALDVSSSALAVAERNANVIGADVLFFQADILTYKSDQKFDLIVSNPPYVRESEKKEMNKNVLEHEPAKALFVTDDDPLIFYEAIINFAKTALVNKGAIYFEVNQYLAKDVTVLLRNAKYDSILIYKDINGNDRFVSGIKSK